MGQTTSGNVIRWANAGDLEAIVEIENDCFDDCWTMDDFLSVKQQRNSVIVVSQIEGSDDDVITGFMVYELVGNRLHVHNMAVMKPYQREGIGESFIGYLMKRLSEKRPNISIECRESNLGAQLFFKHCDLECEKILRSHYDNGEDAYCFRYNLFGK